MSELLTRDEERWAHEHLTHCTSALGQGRALKVLAALDSIRAALGMPDASVEECVGRIRALCESDKRFTQAADMFRHREDVNCNLLTDLADKESQLAAAQAREQKLADYLPAIHQRIADGQYVEACSLIGLAVTEKRDTSALEAEIEKRMKCQCACCADHQSGCHCPDYPQEGRCDCNACLERQLAEARRDTERLRKLLWLRHGHEALYGDDGEMQCSQCMIDFKRDDAAVIEQRFMAQGLHAIGETDTTGPCAEPIDLMEALRGALAKADPGPKAAIETAKKAESLPWEPLEKTT